MGGAVVMEELFGASLERGTGAVGTSDALAGASHVAIYFSAHWCPPCRGFTPKLVEVYNELQGTDKKLEVVFVSSDRDTAQFDEYFGEMPWLALPYAERERKAALSRRFKVKGIPTLVVVDANTGEIVGRNARAGVMKSGAAGFPWPDPTVRSVLKGQTLVRCAGAAEGAGEAIPFGELESKGKGLLLYFSAHWCPPCRAFTPKLVEWYNKAQADGANFELIFVSADRDKDSYDEYVSSMPWLALPFSEESDVASGLNDVFSVSGIPHLVALNPDMSVLNSDACSCVGRGAAYPDGFVPPLVNSIDDGIDDLNEKVCVVVMAEEAPMSQDANVAVLEEVAKERAETGDDGADEVAFMQANEQSNITQQLRKLAKLPMRPKLNDQSVLLMDLPQDTIYVMKTGFNLTADAVRKLLVDHKAGAIDDALKVDLAC